MFVISTAGHVDHGKSALVRALTGTDPDRLAEEKRRGMTIDLGFAWLKLPGGTEVSIVDVPGHERFVKNMLAGVGGIDLALLVIAADEGVMPQTREHLAILDLLGVARAVLVVTKSDLVEPDWLDLVSADVEEHVKGTTLQGSPLVRCSASTGEGLSELVMQIEAQLNETPRKRDLGRPRLAIDRVFTVAGFGTVVTGTLIDGVFTLGQEVEVVPALEGGQVTALRSRIRSLQSHNSAIEEALPGTRTAANLVGLEPEQLWRGQIVTTPGWLRASMAVDVRLRALASIQRPLRHNLNVTFHSLASEAPAQLRLLEADELLPGEQAWAQLRLFKSLAPLKGDRFIIRDANHTLGGGVVVETQAKRHPRRRASTIAGLERHSSADPAEVLYAVISAAEPAELEPALDRLDIRAEDAQAALARLAGARRIVLLGELDRFAYTAAGFEQLHKKAMTALDDYLKRHLLRRGMPKEELRNRLNLSSRLFPLIVRTLVERGELLEMATEVGPVGHVPRLNREQETAAAAYLAALHASPFSPPTDQRPPEDLVVYLIESGVVIDVGTGVVLTREAIDAMTEKVVQALKSNGQITIAEVRDLLGSSRRYVQAFLEYLDRQHVTVRRGDERVLRREPVVKAD